MNAVFVASEAPEVTEVRPYAVLAARKADLEVALVKFAKRCAKKGFAAPIWTWGKAYTEERARVSVDEDTGERTEWTEQIPRIPLTFAGDTAPKHGGWTFLAAISFLEGNALIRALPGASVPVEYRTRGNACEHCNQKRNRIDVYVLRHDSGRHLQVGSTCIADFLGGENASDLAWRASLLAEMHGTAEGACDGEGGFGEGSGVFALDAFLPMVSAEIREGGWVSRSYARESIKLVVATADMVLSRRDRQKKGEPIATVGPEDVARGNAAREWAEALTDEECASDYMHNVRAVARAGLVDGRAAGIAASILPAFDKDIAKRIERAKRGESVYVGTVGAKFSGMLTLAFQTSFETRFGWSYLYGFRDDAGNAIVWKASSSQDLNTQGTYFVRGTIKAHEEYKGTQQTKLTRCAVFPRAKACEKCLGTGKAKRGGTCKACDGAGLVCDFAPEPKAES